MTADSKKKTAPKNPARKKVAKKATASASETTPKKVAKKAVVNVREAPARKIKKQSTASSRPGKSSISISPEERWKLIAIAAYHRAEKRGFAPGDELQDWIEAEKEIDTLMTS
jgi:hypothetical protein